MSEEEIKETAPAEEQQKPAMSEGQAILAAADSAAAPADADAAKKRPKGKVLPAGLAFAGCGMAMAGIVQNYVLLFLAVMLCLTAGVSFGLAALRRRG